MSNEGRYRLTGEDVLKISKSDIRNRVYRSGGTAAEPACVDGAMAR